jgi:hypothetical protein
VISNCFNSDIIFIIDKLADKIFDLFSFDSCEIEFFLDRVQSAFDEFEFVIMIDLIERI